MKKLKITAAVSLVLLFAVLLTVFSGKAAEFAKDALYLCACSIIPSLFPYMVISSMIVSSKVGFLSGKIFPLSRLYNLPDCATCAIILGAVCGFPVGAKTAVSLYKSKSLTKTQTEVLISCANNTGPSFVVSVIGASFFRSVTFGWKLYGFQILSSFICALFVNRIIFPTEKAENESFKVKLSMPDFFSAVTDSANSVITVCAFIVFFFVIQSFMLPFISRFSSDCAGLFSALLEFTKGAENASIIGGARGRFLAGLSVGWSGLSVFSQTCAFTAPCRLSLKRTYATKALQGVLCGLFTAFFAKDTPISETASPAGLYGKVFNLNISNSLTVIITATLFCITIVSILWKKSKKHLDL